MSEKSETKHDSSDTFARVVDKKELKEKKLKFISAAPKILPPKHYVFNGNEKQKGFKLPGTAAVAYLCFFFLFPFCKFHQFFAMLLCHIVSSRRRYKEEVVA